MAARARRLAYRALALVAIGTAVATGALLALKTQRPAHARTPNREMRASHTIAIASPDGGEPIPIATVLPPPAHDAGPELPPWPPPLLNPTASLRMAWDLAVGRPASHEILFTFDDGPNPGTTDRLLGMLDRAHYHAIFFVCGWRFEQEEPMRSRARALLRDEFVRGHIIGNHTVHHYNMATLPADRARYEIDHNADLIQDVIGERPHLFRPPYGSYSEFVRDRVVNRGDELIVWSIDSHDWQMVGNAQAVAMNVIRLIGNMAGGTVLLHDTHPWSVSAFQMVLRWLDTENRDRVARGRPPYRVMEPREFLEGERARLPMLMAQYEAAAREARHARRQGATDAGAASDGAETTTGDPGIGGGVSEASPAPSGAPAAGP